MIEDQDKIGKLGFDLLDQIEKHYGDSDAKVHQVIVLAEIEYTDEDGDRSTHVVYEYDEWRPLARQGLILNGAKAMGVLP